MDPYNQHPQPEQSQNTPPQPEPITRESLPPVAQQSQPNPVPPTSSATHGADQSQRNKLAAYALCVSNLGLFGVHDLYLGNRTRGLIKMFAIPASILLMIVVAFIPGLGALTFAIGALATLLYLFILVSWIVDLFRLYLSVNTDRNGNPLASTPRDKKFLKGLFIYVVASILLMPVLLILSFILGQASFQSQINERAIQSQTRYEITNPET